MVVEVLSENLEYPIIWNLSSPVGAGFKELYCKKNYNQLH